MEKKDFGGNVFNTEHVDYNMVNSRPSVSSADRSSFTFVEGINKNATKKTIIKFGKHNDHPSFLKELLGISSMHRSLVETKANLTMGDDLSFITKNPADAKSVYDFFDNLGLIQAREKIALDICTFGGFVMQHAYMTNVAITKPGQSKRKLEMAYKHDFDEFRLLNPVKNKYGIYEPTYGALHPCWGKTYRSSDTLYLPLWFDETKNTDFSLDKDIYDNLTKEELLSFENRFFYYDKTYSNIAKYYPVPDYQTRAGINAIILDGELIEFDVQELRNGLTVGYIITFIRKDWSKEDPEKEERIREAERAVVRNDMTGSQNRGRVTIARVEPSADGAKQSKGFEIAEIPNNNTSDRHDIIEKRKNAYLLVAHGIVAPEIAGIASNGNAFSSDADRIVDAISNLFFIRLNKFRAVMERYYLAVAKEAGFDVQSVSFVDKIPFRKKIDSAILKHAFLIDEIRKMNNYPALTAEEQATLNEEKAKSVSTNGKQAKLNL